ncbi:aldehyde dehydrogenase family protein [Nocardioides hwasunensis]|uniref:Aldehyde dehydrogenase family protein n=1 Tax=Nocardioides hwasunensis TaxID=397258 RepID=A0ABR8MKA7_9ACTN|nr:aldehyde dehydrogenase family protein [Nocardioides hwasunensis]MBD3915721.1 aldehyde dehydrogenase family protein [Nocardioides hwasunensis]
MSKHAGADGLPIDGAVRTTAEGWTFLARSPATGEHLWDVPDAGLADVDHAAGSAWNAFHATGWSTDRGMRFDAVTGLHGALKARADDLVELMATETGVPVSLRTAHLDAAVVEFASERHPQPGVTVVVTPATAPLSVAVEEIGRILTAGGTVVLKPAPEAASAALELGRIALEFLPRGVLNVVATRDVDVAIALTQDRRVDEVSFTGSAYAGERVRDAAERARKRVRLDVGAPLTIRAADDADLRAVVSAAAVTVAANAGQSCRLPSTVVVPLHRYMEALGAAVEAMESVAVGDPSAPGTLCGPLRSPVARDRVLRYVDLARAEGGDVALGGHTLDRDGGWWIAPTVIGGLDRQSRLVSEEVLGPVLMVVPEGRGSSGRG